MGKDRGRTREEGVEAEVQAPHGVERGTPILTNNPCKAQPLDEASIQHMFVVEVAEYVQQGDWRLARWRGSVSG